MLYLFLITHFWGKRARPSNYWWDECNNYAINYELEPLAFKFGGACIFAAAAAAAEMTIIGFLLLRRDLKKWEKETAPSSGGRGGSRSGRNCAIATHSSLKMHIQR